MNETTLFLQPANDQITGHIWSYCSQLNPIASSHNVSTVLFATYLSSSVLGILMKAPLPRLVKVQTKLWRPVFIHVVWYVIIHVFMSTLLLVNGGYI